MNCRETERLLDTFFDGELDGRLMRDAALHVTRCPTCEQEIQRRESVHDLLVRSISQEVGSDDLSVWSSIEAKLVRSPEEPVIAAATSSLRGVLVGKRGGGTSVSPETGWTRAAPRRRLPGMLSVASVSALAASVLLVLVLASEQSEISGDGARQTAGETSGVAPIASLAPASVGVQGGSAAPIVAVRGGAAKDPTTASGGRQAPRQVQIDALEYTGGPMALWREPASETTIIWIGDSDPRKPAR